MKTRHNSKCLQISYKSYICVWVLQQIIYAHRHVPLHRRQLSRRRVRLDWHRLARRRIRLHRHHLARCRVRLHRQQLTRRCVRLDRQRLTLRRVWLHGNTSLAVVSNFTAAILSSSSATKPTPTQRDIEPRIFTSRVTIVTTFDSGLDTSGDSDYSDDEWGSEVLP